MRAEIERKLGIDAIDIYGLTEVMGPGVASECIETKDGPVIWEDHFYPKSSTRNRRGAARRRRGRTGVSPDQGSLPGHPLPHPRPDPPAAADRPFFRRIGKITGRSDDMLIVRGVNVPDPDRGSRSCATSA